MILNDFTAITSTKTHDHEIKFMFYFFFHNKFNFRPNFSKKQ